MKRIIVVLALMAAGTAQAEVKETIHYTRSLTGAEVEQVMQEELKQRRAEQAFRAYAAYIGAGTLPFLDARRAAENDADDAMIMAAYRGFLTRYYKPYMADLDGYIITLRDGVDGLVNKMGYVLLPKEHQKLSEDELRTIYNSEAVKVWTPDGLLRGLESSSYMDAYNYDELLKKPEIKTVVDEALALAKETLATMKVRDAGNDENW